MSAPSLSNSYAEPPHRRWLRLNRHARSLMGSLSVAWQPLGLLHYCCSKCRARSLLREFSDEGLIEIQADDYRQRARPRLLYRLTLAGCEAKTGWGL
jgi:hypothetical protein